VRYFCAVTRATQQGKFELESAIGRIDADQDGADFRGRELRQAPLKAIRRPYADAITLADAERQQSCSKPVHPFSILAVTPAHALMAHDQTVA